MTEPQIIKSAGVDAAVYLKCLRMGACGGPGHAALRWSVLCTHPRRLALYGRGG